MRWLLSLLFAAFLALATAGNVVINGVCRDCSPPIGEHVFIGGKEYKGTPGAGNVYINNQDMHGAAAGDAPYQVPDGYSGRVPGGSYVHNADCNGCDISG
ncbi:IM23 [Drosophila busckii]|uniref:IM23 n=1 Tax=Drosophila busckii TaxID=30019 RepID=A0A0M4EWX5_DROBS|nr:immune-induced peptide 23 [Drosophila busckii]ALC42395.1 IM23 [Drosophila busckii]